MANIMYGNDILHYKQLGLIPRWSVDITFENIYAPNTGTAKYLTQIFINLNSEVDGN